MKTHSFETLIHQFFKAVQFHVKVRDLAGNEVEPQEWFVVPLGVRSAIGHHFESGGKHHRRKHRELSVQSRLADDGRGGAGPRVDAIYRRIKNFYRHPLGNPVESLLLCNVKIE